MGAGTLKSMDAQARARVYGALAEMLNVTDRPVAPAIEVLLSSPLEAPLDPRLYDAASAATEWVANGEDPPLAPELRVLFGEGFCHRCLPKVPACAAFYVLDAETTRNQLKELYDWSGFECTEFIPECAGAGYVSQLLSFASYCLDRTDERPDILERAAPLLRESFFDWAPLFARALVNSTAHPAALFAGLTLESILDHETTLAS